MTDQLALALPDPIAGNFRKNGTEGERTAARICNAEGERSRIIACLSVSWHPMSVAEIVKSTGIPRDHVASRLPVMERKGQVQHVGFRDNEHGVPVKVWAYRTPGPVEVATGGRL